MSTPPDSQSSPEPRSRKPSSPAEPERAGSPSVDAARLARDLTALFPIPAVPPTRDAAILAAARRHLSRRVARQRPVRPSVWRGAAAAAAVLLILAGATRWFDPNDTPLAGDLDRDGRRTIVDVYRLARSVQLGVRLPGADVDGDGAIDARDLDAILDDTVRLDRPSETARD